MKRFFVLLFVLCTISACASQEAHLIYLPEQTPTPEAHQTPTPSPAPEPLELAPIEGEAFTMDENGLPILNAQTHYYDYYLSVGNLRVYEQNDQTLLDATVTNSFQGVLSGGLRISFYDETGMLYGYGDLRTASGPLRLFPGENHVYADVLTEVDVQGMDFAFTVTEPFAPEK